MPKGTNDGVKKRGDAMTPLRGRLLKVQDAAAFVGISERQLRTVIARRGITVARHPSGRLMGVYEQDAKAWLEQRLSKSESDSKVRGVDERMRAFLPAQLRYAR